MMGKWFRRKRNAEVLEENSSEELSEQEVKLEPEKVDLNNSQSRLAYIERLYDEIKEAKKQCEDAKFEYGQATSYLKDIQLIDGANEEQRKVIHDVADGITELTRERNRLQKQQYKITDEQRLAMETNEERLENDVKNLLEQEKHMLQVKNDLRQLNSEKNLLLSDKREIMERQGMLKVLSKCVAIISVSMLALIVVVYFCFLVEITYPFIGLVAFVFITLLFIMYESRKNRLDMAITEQKCNRAITLSNKVKIKYVNTQNVIEVICRRYCVRDGIEMDFVYGQYRKAKAEWNRQQESTKLLAKYNEVLMHELQKLGVKDREIWFYQAEALVSNKEMVEVRHRLNTERQRLRERLDYNADIMEKCLHEMEKIRSVSSEYEQDVENVLRDKG